MRDRLNECVVKLRISLKATIKTFPSPPVSFKHKEIIDYILITNLMH